jgi:hypothetical protein
MSHVYGTGHRARTAVAVAALLLGGVASSHAALTPESCLAKKLKEWGNLRKCQAIENGKALQGKPADPSKCQAKFDDKLGKINAQATAAAIACRYEVNTGTQAGTATDYDTGLQWEQKTDDATVHDKDNMYSWCANADSDFACDNAANPPDGPAFTAFLGTLNHGTSADGATTTGCFTGHCDWRLPGIGELAGIVGLSAPGCSTLTGPCIDQTIFGPTVANVYWSATTNATFPLFAWGLLFDFGVVGNVPKNDGYYVRAVRSGL